MEKIGKSALAHDDYWASAAAFVATHAAMRDRIVGPGEFVERIPRTIAASPRLAEAPSSLGWVVVHKGQLERFDPAFLHSVASQCRAVYANEVFVVFASNSELPSLEPDNIHLRAFDIGLTAVESRHAHLAGPRVSIPFEPQPYVRPVPDPALRLDPRSALNQICDISDWREGRMLDILAEMRTPMRIHRKCWELGKCLAGLERLGAIRPDARALSVGAGAETSLFYLANHIELMVATDLYLDQSGVWGWGRDFMEDPTRYQPFPFRREGLEVHDMSGLDLRFPDASFDFVYTLSSIEHFGGHEAAAAAIREMARVTRPGGIVCVVTELMLSTELMPDFFTLPEVHQYLIGASDLRLIEPDIDLRISESLLAHPSHMSRHPDTVSPHLVVTGFGDTQATWTSLILFFRR